ncbi:MAG: 16S rRNA (adenine(1518)-N(6)/adenine(1519)-N(6))-dimethyltransferase RsmA [Pseudomonadota bacterium]
MSGADHHRPRKRFGQNFLVDDAVIARIVAAIAPRPSEHIIEIGPGRQAITGPLIDSGARVTVVEIDRDLAERLRTLRPELEVVEADALSVDFAALAGGAPYRLVGNLPYNISTPLLFHLLAQAPPPQDMHFMLQREVVQRMVAGAGDRAQGRLGLMCQNRARLEWLFDVSPQAFEPAPRVDSAIVRVHPRPAPLVPEALESTFDEVVRLAFAKRRKTLRNSLKDRLDAPAIEAAGVDPSARPETLGFDAFLALARQAAYDGEESRGSP